MHRDFRAVAIAEIEVPPVPEMGRANNLPLTR